MSSEVFYIMQAIYYILLLRPSPFLGVLDFYVLVPFSKLIQRRYQVADLTLRDRLGSGNFGQVKIRLPIESMATIFLRCESSFHAEVCKLQLCLVY